MGALAGGGVANGLGDRRMGDTVATGSLDGPAEEAVVVRPDTSSSLVWAMPQPAGSRVRAAAAMTSGDGHERRLLMVVVRASRHDVARRCTGRDLSGVRGRADLPRLAGRTGRLLHHVGELVRKKLFARGCSGVESPR